MIATPDTRASSSSACISSLAYGVSKNGHTKESRSDPGYRDPGPGPGTRGTRIAAVNEAGFDRVTVTGSPSTVVRAVCIVASNV